MEPLSDHCAAFETQVAKTMAYVASSRPLAADHPWRAHQGPGALPPLSQAPKVLLPGEREQRVREERLANGLPVDSGMWGEVLAAGEMVGVTAKTLEALVTGSEI